MTVYIATINQVHSELYLTIAGDEEHAEYKMKEYAKNQESDDIRLDVEPEINILGELGELIKEVQDAEDQTVSYVL